MCCVFPFTFAYPISFLGTAYGNVVFFVLTLHAFDKSLVFFRSLFLTAPEHLLRQTIEGGAFSIISKNIGISNMFDIS